MKKGWLVLFILLSVSAYADKQALGVVEKVILYTPVGQEEITTTIDTGADSSSIDLDLALQLGLEPNDEILIITDARGKERRNTIDLHFTISDKEIYTKGTVANRTDLSTKMLIGSKDLQDFIVDPSASYLTIPQARTEQRIMVIIKHILERKYAKMILIIPILSMFIIILRHMIGLQTYGVFGPLVVAMSLVQIGITQGMVFYLILLVTGLFAKILLRGFKLPLISEISILMFILSGTMIVISIIFNMSQAALTKILFPMIITSFIIERFSQTLEVHPTWNALEIFFATLTTSVVLAYIGLWLLNLRTDFLLAAFGISFISVIFMGNYVGLRLSEIFRFKLLGEK